MSWIFIISELYLSTFIGNKTEDPSVPYAGQDYIRVLNVFEIIKPLKEQNNTKRNPNVP